MAKPGSIGKTMGTERMRAVIDPKFIDDLAKRFADSVPPGIRQLQTELEKNFHAILQATFARMDLVTREEFDIQQQVLARTRAKLEDLERQVTEMEARTPQEPSQRAKASPRKTGTTRRKPSKPKEPDEADSN